MKSRSYGALNKLYYLLFAIAAPLLLYSGARAVAPASSDMGLYYTSAEIMKVDMPMLISGLFELPYTGSDQKFVILQDRYTGSGTIYYKLGDDGTWSNEAPHFKSLGKRDVYYYVTGDRNYNDLGNPESPQKLTVKVADWGRKVDNKKTTNYVDQYGKTSAVVDKKGIIWINMGSAGNNNSGWYGIDNSSGTFEM